MRLISIAFLVATALAGASAAHAQPGVPYEPPPVDFVDPADAPAPVRPIAQPVDGTAAEGAPVDAAGGEPAEAAPSPRRARGRRPNTPAPRPARARVDVSAYVEGQAGVSVQLLGDSDEDVLTYTSVAAGVQGQILTRRVQASGGYRYERRIALTGDIPDEDIHSGIARARAEIVPNAVSIEAGALATRTGGAGRAIGVTQRERGTEVYSGYVGPSVATRVGPVAVNAAYRLGYVSVDDDSLSGAGAPVGGFDSTVHNATASVGVAPGDALPVGLTASAGYVREDSGALNNRFEGTFVRGDVVVPVSPTVAVTAGIGYSRVRASQSDVRRGPGGIPARDRDGRFVADESRPRLLTFDSDGLYYDAGVIWRPSPRAELQLRAGQDSDGDTIVVGSAAVQIGRNAGVTATVFDQDTAFGQNLLNNLRNLPTDFQVERNPANGDFQSGCVFGSTPGQGGCLASSLQSISNIAYRSRGASVVAGIEGRRWSFGAGVSYTRRDFYLPNDPLFASAFATRDEDVSVFVAVSRTITRDIRLSFNPYVTLYNSDLASQLGGFSTGTSVGLSRSFLTNRLQLLVSLGVSYSSLLEDPSLIANGLIGLRYTF